MFNAEKLLLLLLLYSHSPDIALLGIIFSIPIALPSVLAQVMNTNASSLTANNATTTGNATTTNATGTNISIVPGASSPNNGKFYDPSPANVAKGTTVTWTNNDSTLHTVTSGTPDTPSSEFDSGIMAAGETFQHTFDKTGEFDYHCSLHPFMTGKVIVS